MANLKLAKDWIGLANTDLIGSKALFEMGEQFFAISAFHAQQAAEKAIKAYLVFESIRAPKSHDIGDLVTLVESKNHKLAESLRPCIELTDYAVAYRYPDAQKQKLAEKDLKKAIEQAELALNEIINRIN